MAMSNLKRLDPVSFQIDEEDNPMSTLAAAEHGSPAGSNLRTWRAIVFGGIGALYIASLFAPSLREALARVFSYFPR
jgi:hypothetical protein